MANFIARFLEKRIAVMFDNFQAGKNAKSSLLKGEGEATDLYLSKKFLNDMLPPRFSVSKASVKRLKWQLALMTLGKDPLVITLEGVDILIEETPKPASDRSGKKKDKKKKKPKSKMSKSKRNAILEGIKVQVINLKVRVELQHSSLHKTPGAPHPFCVLEVERIRVFNTNSQWEEVTDLGKIHVINQGSGEALAFKRLLISGLSLSIFDSAQIPFTSSPEDAFQACKVLNNVRLLGGLAAKRRCTDWRLISFKYELEIQELKVRLGRRELFMVRHFVQGLARASKKIPKESRSDERRRSAEDIMENASDEEEGGDGEDLDHESLDSILQAQKTFWTEGDEKWCGYIDNSISVYLKMAELAAHQDEESDSPGFLILLSLFQLRFWPAQGQLGKALPGKSHNLLEATAQFFTIKEVNPAISKPPAHLSLLSPKPGKDGQAVLTVRVHADVFKPKEIASIPSPIKVDVAIAPLSVVFDPVVWRRLYRFFAGGALEKAWYSERRKEEEKKERRRKDKAGAEKKPKVPVVLTVNVDTVDLVAPAYEFVSDDHNTYEESARVNELRAYGKNIAFKLKTSDRYECPLRDGMFAPRSRQFPTAAGDFEASSVAESFLARLPWLQLGLDALSLTYCKEGVEQRRKVLLLDAIGLGVVKHKEHGGEMPSPKFEVWFEIEREAVVDWGVDHTSHIKNLWHAFSKGPEAQALHDEEQQTELMVKALEAAREGADKYTMVSQKRKKKKKGSSAFKLAASVRVNKGRLTGRVEGLECHVNFSRVDVIFELRARSRLIKAHSQGLEFFLRQPEKGGDEVGGGGGHLKLRFETYKGGEGEGAGEGLGDGEGEGGRKLQARLLVVEVEGLTLALDIRSVRALRGLLTGGVVVSPKKKKDAKDEKKGSKLPALLAGLHVLLSLNKVDVDFTGILRGLRDCPISSSLRHVTLHNRAVLENPSSRVDGKLGNYLGHQYGSPTSITVWQRDKHEKQVPGLDGLERLRRTEDEVMAALEALETSFVVGPLATVEASSQATGHGGEFIANVTRVQLSGFLDELQRCRRSLAGMYSKEGLQPREGGRREENGDGGVGGMDNGVGKAGGKAGGKSEMNGNGGHAGGELGGGGGGLRDGGEMVRGLQSSINLTRTCLQVLLDEMEIVGDSDEDDEEPRSVADSFDIDANLNGMTSDEMVESFKAFCRDERIQQEYEMLQSMETGPEIKEPKGLAKQSSNFALVQAATGSLPRSTQGAASGPVKSGSSSKFGSLSAKVQEARRTGTSTSGRSRKNSLAD